MNSLLRIRYFMEGVNSSLEYLPTSLSNRLVTYEPIPVLPPKKLVYNEISFDARVRNVPRSHMLEQSFQPYLRASKQVNVIKHLYDKYKFAEFDMSVERQNQFLHDSPRNADYRISRMPEFEGAGKIKGGRGGRKVERIRRKVESVKFPPIVNGYFQKFDMHLSDLAISSTKIRN